MYGNGDRNDPLTKDYVLTKEKGMSEKKKKYFFVFRDENTNILRKIELLKYVGDYSLDVLSEEYIKSGRNNNKKIMAYYEEKITENLYKEIEERDLEGKFGVHDYCTTNDENFSEIHLIGYTSYEIRGKKKWEKLMNIWKDILKKYKFEINETIIEEKIVS